MSLAEHDRPEVVGAALRRKRMVWTEAKDARLKELCDQGVPYDLMATDLSIEFEESIGRESVKDRAWKLGFRRTAPSIWTPEKIEQLVKHFNEGLSCSIIGDLLGVSRNSVIGRLSRMGLSKPKPEVRLVRTGNGKKARRDSAVILQFRAKAVAFKERAATVVPLCIELADLEPHHCRYPYLNGPYVFCGHTKRPGSSYCPEHFALTWQPARAR